MQQTERCTCGAVLPFENADRLENRTPCSSCGSTSRIFELLFQAKMTPLKTDLGLKAKSTGQRKPWYESFGGADWSRTFQKFMEKTRTINRRSDHYTEVVKDPDTGEVIHHCSEPLSQHRNHGSASKTIETAS
jgi:hypothetical protein